MIKEPILTNIELILKECQKQGITSDLHKAYILGTAMHECGLIPVAEKKAAVGTTVWNRQKKYWGTGYYGRGFVQLTHKDNYEKFSKLLGIDLVKTPDLALNTDIAAKILVVGMRDGLFRGGFSLTTTIPTDITEHEDIEKAFNNARQIINGYVPKQVASATSHALYFLRLIRIFK